MYNNKKYIVIIFLCIFSLVFLIFKSYAVEKVISEKQKKIRQIDVKAAAKNTAIKKFGYSDIINDFENQEKVKIIRLIQQKEDNVVSVEVEILGDISLVEEILKDIKDKDNFQNIQNIKIEKREDNSIITRLDMNFIKNK